MRKVFLFILLTLAVSTYAQMNIVCVGEPGSIKQFTQGGDTIYIFKDEIHIQSKIGEVDLYSTITGLPVQTGSEEFFPDDGGYFIVKNDVEYSPFYVFHYTELGEISMSAEIDCDATILTINGDTKPFVYYRRDGNKGVCTRACSLSYDTLTWNGERWSDTTVVEVGKLKSTFSLPALYAATPIRLCYDPEIRSSFGLDSACVEMELSEADIKAVKMHLTSIVVTRNDSNELERPTDAKIIDAGSTATISGPFEVAFYSNPTPAAQFYRWIMYDPDSIKIVRTGNPEERFTPSKSGIHRVVCYVNSPHCADSSEVLVKVADSYLAVPNVFTPNGDGKHDEFRVSYKSIKQFHIWVYNRWGKLVYESIDPAKGWDGTINGRQAAVGAYYYVIRALGTDADENAKFMMKAIYNKKKKDTENPLIGVYQLSGDINLLR